MVLDRHVLTLDIAGFPEGVAERGCERRESLWRPGVEKPDHRHHRLLRACRERPCSRRAAEQRDELAAPHGTSPPAETPGEPRLSHSEPTGGATRARIILPRLGVPPAPRQL